MKCGLRLKIIHQAPVGIFRGVSQAMVPIVESVAAACRIERTAACLPTTVCLYFNGDPCDVLLLRDPSKGVAFFFLL